MSGLIPKTTPLSLAVVQMLAGMCKLTHVIVVGHDGRNETVLSFGTDAEASEMAAGVANRIRELLGDVREAQPSVISGLSARVKTLETALRNSIYTLNTINAEAELDSLAQIIEQLERSLRVDDGG